MFERFNDDARHSIVFAQEESRELGHEGIGTEHLLLGLFRVEVGGASVTLRSFGVTITDAREAAAAIFGRGDGPSRSHIPFTPRAKHVLETSLRGALLLDHPYIGSEHLLLGLLGESEGGAAEMLARLGIDPEEGRARARAALSAPPGPPSQPVGAAGEVSPEQARMLDHVTQQAIASANRRARQLAKELETVRAAKDAALDAGDLTRAVTLRRQERDLLADRARLLQEIPPRRLKPEPEPEPPSD